MRDSFYLADTVVVVVIEPNLVSQIENEPSKFEKLKFMNIDTFRKHLLKQSS